MEPTQPRSPEPRRSKSAELRSGSDNPADEWTLTRPGVATTAPADRRERRNQRPSAVPAPGPAVPSVAKSAAATNDSAAAAIAQARSAPAAAAPAVHSDILAAHNASTPMAIAALTSLTTMAAGFGSGTPTADTGQPYAPPMTGNGAPTGPIAWDGGLGSGYSASNTARAERDSAIGDLNAELSRVLGDTVDTSARGRATMSAIIAEVDAALTALGPVSNTAAGRRQVMVTLGDALARAGNTVDQSRMAAVLDSQRIEALAAKYVQDSHPTRTVYRTGGSGSSGPPSSMPAGETGLWINQALQILAQNGYDVSRIDPGAIATIIAHESSGNPHAINLWDSNAVAGHPSKGLMQTIDSTFNAYALPGHRDIWNPVDNIIAGVRYSIDRYGSVSNVPGVANLHGGGSYVGY
ncbi:transglycosylase SLT domain-containing protein [Nocardia sp. 852002-20019_SCH5090214]|uniref:transglycosylase SLT domain-containing protein n=1 Tax=Nocardia sp. 852002-20019_SCH5090214 TaxID=1834087 RepID=UPI000B2EED81|nr:transglycosylase SLT domain-containing protein [Nocardia sp. 852002-20019_SCH5090214]